MTLDERLTKAAHRLADDLTAPVLDLDALRTKARANHRRNTALAVAAATVSAAIGIGLLASGVGNSRTDPPPIDHPAPGMDDVVWAAEPGATETRVTVDQPGITLTLPTAVELLKEPRAEPLPAWSAFDPETGTFLWTDRPEDPGSTFTGPRTLMILSAGADPELAEIPCDHCSDVLTFGPEPDEVTVLTMDLGKDPVNPGPESLARVYAFDGSLRDEIDLAEVMGTDRHVSEETGDWVPPDGSEALISDIEWDPDGTRLAVSTYPGFFEPDCPPGDRPCEALVWIFDRDGSDPVVVHRQPTYTQDDGVWMSPVLTDLAWTADGARLGMVVAADRQERADRPPTLVALDVESGSALTMYEFGDCGRCRSALYGFAWSPDGTRLAVTSGEGIEVLDPSGGTVLSRLAHGGPAPLAWLPAAR